MAMLQRLPSVRDIDENFIKNQEASGASGTIKRTNDEHEVLHETITRSISQTHINQTSRNLYTELLDSNNPDAVVARVKTLESINQVFENWIDPLNAEPLHELLTVHKLELYGLCLSEMLEIATRVEKGRPLLPDLKKDADKLTDLYNIWSAAIQNNECPSPATQSIVDNYPLIFEQLHVVAQDLPSDYYDELPKIDSGPLSGRPRVYAIALVLVAFTDAVIEPQTLTKVIDSFQFLTPLTIGELWSLPTTLRVILFEQLTALGERIEFHRTQKRQADEIADLLLSMLYLPSLSPDDLTINLGELLAANEELDRTLAVHLLQRLRDQSPLLRSAIDWLENQLMERYQLNCSEVAHSDHHAQACYQTTVQNVINSMRILQSIDWLSIVETTSFVHKILCRDPCAVFPHMSIKTRDQYRHAVERISKRSSASQINVAQLCIERANQFTEDPRKGHVGYWLVDVGMHNIEDTVLYEPTLREQAYRLIKSIPTAFYLSSLAFLTILIVVCNLACFIGFSVESPSMIMLLVYGAVMLLPCSELGLSLLNHTITLLVRPQEFPAMSTAEAGIPLSARTMVCIPMLLAHHDEIIEIVRRLEVHYLANQDDNIFFSLLCDFTDAQQQVMPTDVSFLSLAQSKIDELNSKYSSNNQLDPRFYLFHRKRLFNSKQGCWMGSERKRGKLEEFNMLLRGSSSTSYVDVNTPSEFLMSIKYVITLDADTSLPRETARLLVGVITHPLNSPVVDEATGIVKDGYGILQPRVSVSLDSCQATRFSQLFSNWIGRDCYRTSCSDIYQDLFGTANFIGKGLYDVDTFLACTKDRIPHDAILSHDLFESLFVKAAFVSTIELADDHPADWNIYSRRQHRWIRGDWQLLPYLMPRIPTSRGLAPNRLPVISRWKIIDNLRRSLVVPSMLLWLVVSWFSASPFVSTLACIGTGFIFPLYVLTTSIIMQLLSSNITSQTFHIWLVSVVHEIQIKISQFVLGVAFMVELSFDTIDAIIRTLYRLFVSHRLLLSWACSAQVERQFNQSREQSKLQELSPMFALALTCLLGAFRLRSLAVAAPFLLAWFFVPWIKAFMRRSPIAKPQLSSESIHSYRAYSRKTWHFFETFVTKDDNFLAPDNYQFDPAPLVAHRTSPTNIGLQLLSTISASDLGFLGKIETLELIENVFKTLNKLERFNNHFLNWYDTSSATALLPKYVSTVDSGNLAAHLIAVKQWALEDRAVGFENKRQGIVDTLNELSNVIPSVTAIANTELLTHLKDSIDSVLTEVSRLPLSTGLDWDKLLRSLDRSLDQFADTLESLRADVKNLEAFQIVQEWKTICQKQIREFQRDRSMLDAIETSYQPRLQDIATKCERLFHEMDFKFLFDEQRKLFCIGYNVSDHRLDHYHYDLLASESRLASFIAIMKGDVRQEHWFRLGRTMTAVSGSQALISWTASVFEYLMPLLVMRSYDSTMLDQTYKAVVKRQIEYGDICGVPWGISESGYNARDLSLNYQYGPWGCPPLGLKRGLADDLVISPYSTMLAAMIDPDEALLNLNRLERLNALQSYGFIEAIDFTAKRLPSTESFALIHSHMAHHSGMSLVAMNNLLNDNIMQSRFHCDPLVESCQLLLQEKVPHNSHLSTPRPDEVTFQGSFSFATQTVPRRYYDASMSTPRVALLSNGHYNVMITTAGGSYSRVDDMAVTRWREDTTLDNYGSWVYLRDVNTHEVWSAFLQPVGRNPDEFECIMTEDKVEVIREDHGIVTHTQILVASNDNVELRRISLTNHGESTRVIEVTTFTELVLTGQNDDDSHPAFHSLFIQTDWDKRSQCLLATRRQRDVNKPQPWAFHLIESSTADSVGTIEYETDRARFIGRGRSAMSPQALSPLTDSLTNTVGAVLDPCFSLRVKVRIPPGTTSHLTCCTGVTHDRDSALNLAEKFHDPLIFHRELSMVWTQSEVQLRHLGIDNQMARDFQRLSSRIIFSDPSLRPQPHVLASNTRQQANLWPYAVSGDFPIILVGIADESEIGLARDIVHAHEYFRLKGLVTELVLLNEYPPSYVQNVQDALTRMVTSSSAASLLDKRCGLMIRRKDIMPAEDVILLKTVARVYLRGDQGTLSNQLSRRHVEPSLPPLLSARPATMASAVPPSPLLAPLHRQLSGPSSAESELSFYNSLGGFSLDGKEYVITLMPGQRPPMPWINVIANNNDFGCVISESGSGYTYSVNSRENRLTPWSNDPVIDPPGEVVYIRDEVTGHFNNPTPLFSSQPDPEKYVIRHSQGYSSFNHTSESIVQNMRVFVPMMPRDKQEGVKVIEVTLQNTSSESRQLSLTWYNDWTLGVQRAQSSRTVVTEIDQTTKAVLARNRYNNEFATRVAFSQLVSDENRSVTCDRTAFIGRNGNIARPAAMFRTRLYGAPSGVFDPCAAIRTSFVLAPNSTRRFIILLGESETVEDARLLITKFSVPENVDAAFQQVIDYWNKTLSTIEINTPDLSMNLMVNRWLIYQTLSCRIWARSAMYQSSGAIGFRDQLQDCMAMVYSHPDLVRQHLIRCAGKQFPEGDVLHWWHDPTGRGVRTRCSDDALFLPFVLCHYMTVTGNTSILKVKVPFLKGALLQPHQQDSYMQPEIDHDNTADILEHCIRVCDRQLHGGVHNLPLMGAHDWNDGMSAVGRLGQGESIWLAWFAYATLKLFADLCESHDLNDKAVTYRERLVSLQAAIETHAWEDDRYIRAYFDSGEPLGSKKNDECQIDSIAQSWAVLSGAGDPHRARKAMQTAEQCLVDRDAQLIKLFTPPFDRGTLNPGYIRGYLPGVRENGGQYTHAAVWMIMAFASLGDGDRATELYSMINPINHTRTRAGVQRYKVEPYVMAADVYSVTPHTGRGGWTFYTGSSSYFYRCAVESILGLTINNKTLSMKPNIPRSWPGFSLTYRAPKSVYRITVTNNMNESDIQKSLPVYELDGQVLRETFIKIAEDDQTHSLRVTL